MSLYGSLGNLFLGNHKMENCLYLFRPEDNSDEHLIPRSGISQHEWQKYIKTDSELKTDDNNHNAVIYCGEKIYWEDGKIFYIDPDELAFYKMLKIANTIDACVCSGDGRQYMTINSYFYPDIFSKPEKPPLLKFEKDRINKKRAWWKRLLNIGTAK